MEPSFSFGPSFEEQENGTLATRSVPQSLLRVFDLLLSGHFVTANEAQFLINPLNHGDYFRVCSDFDDYVRVQQEMESVWRDKAEWTRRSIYTVAGMGKFSSDNA